MKMKDSGGLLNTTPLHSMAEPPQDQHVWVLLMIERATANFTILGIYRSHQAAHARSQDYYNTHDVPQTTYFFCVEQVVKEH